MKTLKRKINMEPLMNQSLHICGCCKRQLPHEAFYTNKRTGALDNYCKECRKANTRKRRDLRRCTSFENKPVSYPVITEVKDPALRMLLILHARQVVAESISRKQEKEKLNTLWEE